MRARNVVILGMHRTGTSLIAGILEKLGVNMGEKQVGIHWSNPLGHFENIDFVKMDDKILRKAGGSWDNPPEISKIKMLLSDEVLKREIQDMIKRNEDVLWGWKVPTSSLTIELYLPFLTNPYFIVCRRKQEDIIRSLEKRDGFGPEKTKILIDKYNDYIENFLNIYPDLEFKELNYDNILKKPYSAILEIVDFLNISPSQKRIQNAIEFVLPREKVEALQNELKKREWFYLLKDILKNPYLFRRYIFKALRDPKYTLKKLGLK